MGRTTRTHQATRHIGPAPCILLSIAHSPYVEHRLRRVARPDTATKLRLGARETSRSSLSPRRAV